MKKEIIKKFCIILIISLLLEIFIFNISSYRTVFGKYEEKICTEPQFLYYSDDSSRVFVLFDNINTKTTTFKIEFNNLEEITDYKIYYSDATTSAYTGGFYKKYIPGYEKSKYIPLNLSGETKSLIIEIDADLYENGKLVEVSVNEKIPFEFNFIRFAIVFFLITFAYFMKNGEIFNREYSNKDLKQELILLLILTAFFMILTFINIYSVNGNESEVYNKDFVEAIVQGQFNLLKNPSEKFIELENPYDALSRNDVERDVDYLWDTAYYNGKQYVYFGILPLLITFLPYYLITKKFLKIYVVVFIFSIFIFILLKEILLKLLSKYFDKIPFKMVVSFLIILCSGSLILYANGMSRVYELVIIVGLYFVLQGLYFIIKSTESEKNKYLNIFLGALFLALSVACRPTDLFASLIIVPYLLSLLIENIKNFKQDKKSLIKLIISVAIPYLTVGILLMWYNYVRFGNIFEFGSKYQITIANMGALGNRFSAIPTGLIANLFSIPNFVPDFPFIENHNKLAVFYGYYYIENMIGGLFIIAPICFMNFYIIKANKKSENKELKILANTLLIVAILITLISIMMAGSNQRYLIDYAYIYIISAILIFMIIYNSLKSDEAKKIMQKILCIITIYTCLIGISSGILSEKDYLKNNSPEEYYKTKYTICFWE